MSSATSNKNPFPGLRPFTQEEDYLFFGREEQTLELLQRLSSNRFVAVVGTSGSGKSSLVRCGLISELLGGRMLDAGSSWEIAVTHPGGNPLALLTDALLDANLYDSEAEHARENLLATLSRSHFGLVEAVKQSDIGEGTNFLLVVDQFEEIFRFQDAGQRQQEVANEFVSLLLEAVVQKDVAIYVVLTMRSDFIGECGQFEGLAEMVNRGEFLIPRLTREQYKRVIEGPIKVAGGKIAPRLLQRLLNDLGQQADQLPCLQHALMRTWNVWAEKADADELDLDDYQRVGKMSQALSLHADEIYDALDSDRQRDLCRGIFQALTVEESNNRGIRRPQRLGRLCQILEVSADELLPVIDAYRHSGVTFLMPSPEVELTDQTIIDISHESLMRVWMRLRRWVEEEAQAVGIYRRLSESATLHAEGKAGLYRDPELGIALAWRAEKRPNQAWAERYRLGFEQAIEFLERSHQAQLADEQVHEVARQRELDQARKLADAERQRAELEQCAARRLRRLAVVMAAVALFAVGASVVAFRSWQDADAARQTAQQSEQSARSNAVEAQREATRATAEEEKATVARRDAEESLTAARTAIDEFLVQVSDSKLLSAPGLQPLRADLLESAGKFYSQFLTKNPDDPRLQAGLADAFYRVGFVNGEMGRYEQAISALEKSIALQEAALKARPTDADLRHRLARTWYQCSVSQRSRNDVQPADASARHAARLWDALSREYPENIDYRKSLARACNILGNTSSQLGDLERAYLAYQHSMQIRLELLEHHPEDVEVLHGLSESFNNIGQLVTDVEQRLSLSERSTEYGAIAHRLSPLNVEYASDHAISYLVLGGNLLSLGRKPQALESWRKGVEHCLAFMRANPAVPAVQEQLETLLKYVRSYSFDAAQADEYASIFRMVRNTFTELPRQTAEDYFKWAQVQSDCVQQLIRARKDFQNRALTSQEEADVAAWRSGSLAALNEAAALGLKDTWRLKQDALLADARSQPKFNELLAKLESAENAAGTGATGAAPMPHASSLDRSVQVAQDRAAGFMAYGVAETWLSRADRANKSFDEALALRQSLADATPDNVQRVVDVIEVREAQIRLARISGQLGQARGQFSQSVAQLEQMLARDLPDSDALIATKTLANIERDYADSLAESGLWDEAGPHFANALRHGLKHRTLLRKTGLTDSLRVEQAYEEILAPLLWLIQPTDQSYPDACRKALTRPEVSSEHAGRIARLCALIPNALPDLAQVLALSDKAQHTWHAYPRGLVRYRMGQFDEAIRIIESAHQRKDLVGVGVEDFVLAMAHFQAGRNEQAQMILSAANQRTPRSMSGWTHEPHNMLDVDWLLLRREANQLIHGSRNAPDDRVRRGQAYVQLNECDKADAELSAAVKEHPDDLKLHWIHAQALWLLNRRDEAAEELSQARQLLDGKGNASIGDVDLWRLAAESYRQCERRDESIAALRQARAGQLLKVMQTPQNWLLRRSFFMLNEELGEALRSAGREAEATTVTEERDALLAGLGVRPVMQSISDTFSETRPRDVQLSASLAALDRLLTPEQALSSGRDAVSRSLRARLLQQRGAMRHEAGRNVESAKDLAAARADYEQLLNGDPQNIELAKGLTDVLMAMDDPRWAVLPPVELKSDSGTPLTRLGDGSILAEGMNPPHDQYTIVAKTGPQPVAAIRFEALLDDSLPQNGPGRNTLGGFVMDYFELLSAPASQPERASRVSFSRMDADYFSAEQPLEVQTGKWHTGGAGGRPHVLIGQPASAIADPDGSLLTFRMVFNHGPQWPGQNLGRFRLSVTSDTAVLSREQRRWVAMKFTDPWAKLGASYALSDDVTQAVNHFVSAIERTTDPAKQPELARQIAQFILSQENLLTGFVQQNHEQPLLMAEVARLLDEQGRNDLAVSLRSKARASLDTKLANEPDNVVVQSVLADVLLRSVDVNWTVLSPSEMTSQEGATLIRLDDQSILAGGANPGKDVYTIKFTDLPPRFQSLRLEVLPHESMPQRGPGRSFNGNFVLTGFHATIQPSDPGKAAQPLPFTHAAASYEQMPHAGDSQQYTLAKMLDPSSDTDGWAVYPQVGRPHMAVFAWPHAVTGGSGSEMTISLLQNCQFDQHAIGHFRLSVADDATGFTQETRRFAAMKLSDARVRLAAAYVLSNELDRAVDLLVRRPTLLKDLLVGWGDIGMLLDDILNSFNERDRDAYAAALPDAARAAAEQGKLDLSRELYRRLASLNPENMLWKERAAQLQPGTLAVWNFDTTAGSWGKPANCEMNVKDGVLTTRPTANDCSLSASISAPAGGKVFALRYRSMRDFTLQVYWSDTAGNFAENRQQPFPVPATADNWRDIVLPFACRDALSALRFDPETGIGNSLEIDSIVLRHVERDEYQRLANELVIEPELARLNNAVVADPKSVARLVERGNFFLRLGRWREAAADFEQDRALNPTSRFVWFRSANCLLLAGDEVGYRKLCQDMVEQFRDTSDSQVADSLCKTCLLRPGTIELSELPIQKLRDAIDDGKQAGLHNWFIGVTALYSYRAGRFDEAIAWTKRNPKPTSQTGALMLVVRAMAEQQLGQHDQARRTLAEMEALLPAELRTLGSPGDTTLLPVPAATIATDWLTAELLRREASQLIK